MERYCLNRDEKPPGRKPAMITEWEYNWHLLVIPNKLPGLALLPNFFRD